MASEPCAPNTALMNYLSAGGDFTESACSADVRSIYPIKGCAWAGWTGACEAVIADSTEYGRMLFIDNEAQSASADEAIYHEHLVHPVMAAVTAVASRLPEALSVLIVGGGEGATAREVLKWAAVHRVVWVDIDGMLVDLCRRHMGFAEDVVYTDPRLEFHAADIWDFFSGSSEQFDVIILDLPDPDVDAIHLGEHCLYSERFMKGVRAHLRANGAVVSHVGPVGPREQDREPMNIVRTMAKLAGIEGCSAVYHTYIPSFQSDWGFWMSVPPAERPVFPTDLRVMSAAAQTYALTWPPFWGVA